MVGILAYLYQQFPGVIVLENLLEGTIASHFLGSNENISRRLEWRLYNKFQNLGLVPPQIKETILLRKDTEIKQFGLMHFIPTENTSKKCPYCGKINKNKEEYEKNKFKLHLFACTNCDFNTQSNCKGMDDLNNSDTVASYNIAKAGYDYILDPPSPKKTKKSSPSNKKNNRNQSSKRTTSVKKEKSIDKNNPFYQGLKDYKK